MSDTKRKYIIASEAIVDYNASEENSTGGYILNKPTKLSDFENDKNFVTSEEVSDSLKNSESHVSDNDIHVTTTDKSNWDAAKTHSEDSSVHVTTTDKSNWDAAKTHSEDSSVHVTTTDKSNWNAAKTHSDSSHAPSNAEKNIIVGIQKNGSDLTVDSSTRKVNIIVPTTAADVGADPSGTAANEVIEHNASTTSHNDIRLLISGLDTRLTALADSDDTTLDQLSELVAYIKANRELIESVTSAKVNVTDIINNLTTNSTDKVLSAAQGVVIAGLIDALESALESHTHSNYVSEVATSGSGNAVTGVSISGNKMTVTKGSTFLTAHPAITMGTDSTSTESPNHGETFIAIDSITKDSNGHVTKVNTKTVTLPNETTLSNTNSIAEPTYMSHGDTFSVITNIDVSGHKINTTIAGFKLPHETELSLSQSGSGNAVTGISVDGHTVKVTKGSTFLTAHPAITVETDTTSAVSPGNGGTFTAIDSVDRDSNGHVTKVNTKTITLPTAVESSEHATNATSATYASTATKAGTATYATNAGTASLATNATNAATATYSTNSAKATSATSATYATTANKAGTATYATNAGTATYSTNAGTATYASNSRTYVGATTASAGTPGFVPAATTATKDNFLRGDGTWAVPSKATSATSARYATTATNAGTATYASNAANATNASTAAYATSAGSANTASSATNATNAATATYSTNSAKATSATSATYASTANYGKQAGTATYATNAGTSAYSQNAAKATSATSATYATNAGTATYASNSRIYVGATTASAGTPGFVPAATTATKDNFLRGDGTWAVPSKATSATSARYATTATSAGSASKATSATSARYATTATNAGTATYATNAANATNSSTAAYATSAGSANTASSATNATNAATATYSTNSAKATSATSARYATTATSAGSASKATSATSATYASTANFAKNVPTFSLNGTILHITL